MAETMKAAQWIGPNEVVAREIPKPEPAAGEALIRVAYGGICGTDIMIYLGKHPRARAPLVMCHEFSGVVENSPGEAFPPGTPVVVNPLLMCGKCYACTHGMPHICERLGLVGIDRDGGFAQYAVVPVEGLCKIPESLSLVQAALIEPLAVAVHAVRVSSLRVGDATAVLGAGPVGILTAQVARLAGAAHVWVAEVSPKRLQIARDLGFETIGSRNHSPVDVIRGDTGGVGLPVVFETAGVQATVSAAGECARVGGEVLQVGMPKQPPVVDLTRLLFGEIRMTPIRVYRQEDVAAAIALAGAGGIDLTTPATHILSLDSLGEGLELSHAATQACKVLIDPTL